MLEIPFGKRYAGLGNAFYVKTRPVPVVRPELIKLNHELAEELGLSISHSDSDEAAQLFSGNIVPDAAEPLAMAYAGHQFGNFVPQLGDGRAILLGDLVNQQGDYLDVQLKGCGRTHYSRNGDGRAALGPVLREYLVSEAMVKLCVPTTRALAVVTTGEEVARECLVPGGVITRVASSFVRVGTFQYFAARGDVQSIRKLADYVVSHNYPEAGEARNPYAALLKQVVTGQASLIAKWMHLGFIHGVMNTDNMSIACETVDYGPCAFMDAYDHERVFSFIDRDGRYAYGNQPSIGLWNLTRLAETLVPLLAEDTDEAVEIAKQILQTYVMQYEHAWLTGMRAKCGLFKASEHTDDNALLQRLLAIMARNNADFTLTFLNLSRLHIHPTEADNTLRNLFNNPGELDEWLVQWRKRLGEETLSDKERQAKMQSVNPVYIPRNHQIEAAIRAAEDYMDFSLFYDLHEVLQNPYQVQSGKDHYMSAPGPDEIVEQTFCGT